MEPVQPEASVVATGLGIRYIGEHCYAYSGAVGSSNTAFTLLQFSTGSGYSVGELTFTGGVEFLSGGLANGLVTAYQLLFNDLPIAIYKCDTNEEDMPSNITVPIIIPPFTKVEINTVSNVSDSADLVSASLTARVYGAE